MIGLEVPIYSNPPACCSTILALVMCIVVFYPALGFSDWDILIWMVQNSRVERGSTNMVEQYEE